MEPLKTNSELSRRELLVRSAAGLGISFVLPGIDLRAAEKRGAERAKSLIMIWMGGGPSQLETWDPHPGSPIGGPTLDLATKIPGLKIAEHYPQLAEQIDHLSVIRSLISKEGDHERGTYYLKTGFRPDPTLKHPSIGAVLVHEIPTPTLEIPMHVTLANSQWPARGGYLGAGYDAFKIFDPGRSIRNMRPRVGKSDRQKRRLENLKVVSQAFRRGRDVQAKRTLHKHMIERALKMMDSKQLAAFKIDDEPKQTVAAYGDSRFGRGCLVARRLIEQGVRAVEVNLMGFDSHANNFEVHQKNGEILDPAFAALIRDLKERDLLESTVVLAIGEFGRTPKINPLDGRDHWPTGFSCIVGGGGLKNGVVIGQTDPLGEKKQPEDPIKVQDLYATIFKTMGVDFERELMTPIGRPMALNSGTPIGQLL